MRVLCRHGHFAFYPKRPGDVARFMEFFEVDLVRDGDFYTFPLLQDAPKYSLAVKPYLGIPATTTFEGDPWAVMRENGFVYHIASGLLVPKQAVFIPINPILTGYYFLAESPLIQPGSQNAAGQKILSYDAEYMQEVNQLRVTEFAYE